jgi:hypothetical protein
MDIFLCIYGDVDESALKAWRGRAVRTVPGPIGDLGLRPLIFIGRGNIQDMVAFLYGMRIETFV